MRFLPFAQKEKNQVVKHIGVLKIMNIISLLANFVKNKINCKGVFAIITNKICENCQSWDVCKIADILYKFDEDAKRYLGVDITIDNCRNYIPVDNEQEAFIIDDTGEVLN